jgi:hypothetical protein
MRSTDFPFAVTPQRLQRGGKLSVDYSAPSADVADLLDPTDIVGRDRLEARETSWRDQLRDKLAVRVGRRNADKLIDLADFTPVGAAFVGNEAALAAREGRRGAAAADVALAALPLPGAGKALKKVAKSPLAVKPQGINAYHGSPYDFDLFDMSKIGTGEGAQAYGHGLYFAENEGVARRYRDALAGNINVLPVSLDGVKYNPPSDTHQRAMAIVAKDGRRGAQEVLRRLRSDGLLDAETEKAYKEVLAATKNANIEPLPAGSMYQVRIDADPADFLDYDAPLSRQKKAFEAVRRFADDTFSGDAFDLQDMLAIKNTKAGDILKQMERTAENPERAAEVLKKAGVPGIKYLDQGSRAAGDGSRNYVVFDDKLITILKKYGWAPGMAIPAAAMAEYEAEQELARGGLAAKYGV